RLMAPLSKYLSIKLMGWFFSSYPTVHPSSAAIIIPVMAPPAISPELNSEPELISDSAAEDFFLLSTNHFTSPPIQMGDVVDSGRYAPTAKARALTPHNSTTAEIPIPTIIKLHGKE